MTLPVQGGVALVTGAASGIGRAFAAALARQGCDLILVGRREAELRRAAEALPGRCEVVPADLATAAGLEAVSRTCPPRLNVLVHSAGLFHHETVARMDAAAWDSLVAINLRAPMLLTAACLDPLRAAGGQVVFINSTAGLAGTGNGAYAATKHALRVAAETLRQELKGSGVRVLSIFPGRTDTTMQHQVLAAEGRPEARIPLLQPEDVADAGLASLRMPRRADVTDLIIRPRNA